MDSTASKASPVKMVQMLLALLKNRGPVAEQEIRGRLDKGQGLVVHGQSYGPDTLRQALQLWDKHRSILMSKSSHANSGDVNIRTPLKRSMPCEDGSSPDSKVTATKRPHLELTQRGASSQGSEMPGSRAVATSSSSSSKASDASKSTSSASAGSSKDPVRQLSGWQSIGSSDLGVWQAFSDERVGGHEWYQRILARDPPCVSLGHNEVATTSMIDSVQRTSTHSSYSNDVLYDAQAGTLGIRTSRLSSLFDDIIHDCRYPPSMLELSWRFLDASTAPPMRDDPLRDPSKDLDGYWETEDDEVHIIKGMRIFLDGDEDDFADMWVTMEDGVRVFNAELDDIDASKGRLEFGGHRLFWEDGEVWQRRLLFQPPDLMSPPSTPFALLGNGDTAPTEQPPHFKQHPLRPEQLRSLAWMRAREGVGADGTDGAPFTVEWRKFLTPPNKSSLAAVLQDDFPFVLDMRAVATYPCRGGILGDKIGFGKTATTIGLIDAGLGEPVPPVPALDSEMFLPSKATLIIVPSNLFEQWLGEISKFLWDGRPLKPLIKKGWISGKGLPLKVFAVSNVNPLKTVTAGELSEADVVICSYRLLFSGIYMSRRTQLIHSNRTSHPASNDTGSASKDHDSDMEVVQDSEPTTRQRRGPWSDCEEEEHSVDEDEHSEPPVAQPVGPPFRYQPLASLAALTKELLKGSARLPSGAKGDTYATDWRELQFPMLEMFHWRRIVYDEFHELESFRSEQQNTLQHLRSQCRWGLTGTPPLDGTPGVVFMSSLFRIDLLGCVPKFHGHDIADFLNRWRRDHLLMELSANFLDSFARQNTAELPHIGLIEHTVEIHHTPNEHALYMAQAHDIPEAAKGDICGPERFEALERLLKLCSHFQVSGGNSTSAEEECQLLSTRKERQVAKTSDEVARCCRVISILESKYVQRPGQKAPLNPWRAELDKTIADLNTEMGSACSALGNHREIDYEARSVDVPKDTGGAASSCGQDDVPGVPETPRLSASSSSDSVNAASFFAIEEASAHAEQQSFSFGKLKTHRPRDERLSALLGMPQPKQTLEPLWRELACRSIEKGLLKQLLKAQYAEQVENIMRLRDAVASQKFFLRSLAALNDHKDAQARTCVICLRENVPLDEYSITPCSHTFCTTCLRKAVKKFKECSVCRHPLAAKDVRPLAAELRPAPVPAANEKDIDKDGKCSEDPFGKYGTKLAAVVRKLQEIRKEDPTAKAIVFTQFDDIRRKVATALQEFGVPVVQLQGSVGQRDKTIREWQTNSTSHQFVLLLSLAQSASGTNLTAASHVLLLHPMLAATRELAMSYEMQAIGRVRRHGQQRSSVHIWRFVTCGTVEEEITNDRNQGSAMPASVSDVPDDHVRHDADYNEIHKES